MLNGRLWSVPLVLLLTFLSLLRRLSVSFRRLIRSQDPAIIPMSADPDNPAADATGGVLLDVTQAVCQKQTVFRQLRGADEVQFLTQNF